MKKKITLLVLLHVLIAKAQEKDANFFSITPEVLIGISSQANSGFPERALQKQLFVNFGWDQTEQWASFLKIPKTGISIGYTNFGNKDKLGEAITILPFLEFNAFKNSNIHVHLGLGASYFTKKYHPITNISNKAVSTDFTWSFKSFMYYNLIKTNQVNWRIGAGYVHNSNGHTKLPNQGYNSFLLSFGAEIYTNKKTPSENIMPIKKDEKTISNYISIRSGYGINVLSEAFDDKESVYTISGEYGKVYNNILRLGIGTYFRYYQAYYNYIANNESLVQNGREFSDLRSNAFANALNIGITANSELLLNHFGIDFQLGINIYKPAYKIDWRINKGWGTVPKVIPESGGLFTLGDIDEPYFKLKRTVSARIGLKYYVIGTAKKPSENIYLGAFINSNFGQADFSEIAIGYVKNFNHRSR